tara:strand:+ start:312 stop:665 length:354 start_codon:yes stop_codon:yes gene_type:complete
MQCKISNCNCGIFTTDGYCEKHKYYTRYDNKIIMYHINEFHIKNINEGIDKETKAKRTISLFRYMSHKREFFIEYPKYHVTVIKKGKEFLEDIKKLLPEEECDKYVSFINEIEQFND